MISQDDRGLERIDPALRAEAWRQASLASMVEAFGVFSAVLEQAGSSEGPSSIGEVQRLWVAEQVSACHFLETEHLPSVWAAYLAQEIEKSFQNPSRPISRAEDPDQVIDEILNYYFEGVDRVNLFQRTLAGEFDVAQDLSIAPAPAPDRFEIQEPKVERDLSKERPVVGAYFRGEGVNLTEKMRGILGQS